MALGFGFRCGFLGLLHMEIIQERLEREFNLELITTAPGVRYKITKTDGEMVEVDNPSRWPDPSEIDKIDEPVILATILTNEEYVGGILALVEEKRGKQKSFEYVSSIAGHAAVRVAAERNRARFLRSPEVGLPRIRLARLPPRRTIGSRRWSSSTFWSPAMPVDALSIIVHRDFAYERGKALVSKMRELIPRQMFEVPIQASIGAKIIARETVHAIRKNVLAKCYGGDITPQTQAARKAKRRQEAHEAHRPRGYSAGGVPRGAEGRRRQLTPLS